MNPVPRITYFPDSSKRCPICGEGVDPDDKRRKFCCNCHPPQHRWPKGVIVYAADVMTSDLPIPPRMRISLSYFVWLELYDLKNRMQEADGAPRRVTYSDVIEGLLRRPEK